MKNSVRARLVPALLCAGLLVGALTGCSSTDDAQSRDAATEQPAELGREQSDGQAAHLGIRDAWVKAADSGMSAAFGVLVNEGRADIRIVSATADASPIMELHETVVGDGGVRVMREKQGGFVIAAGGEYALQPGDNHLMLMDIIDPVLAGNLVNIALEMEDGSVFEFEAPIKDYSGANENYVNE